MAIRPTRVKPYLHGDILPGKLLKIEQASEKSSCKLGIFLCHIVRPLTQPNCLEIEHTAIFSGKWNSPRVFLWYVDGFCIHFCRSFWRKRGKSSWILHCQGSHSSTFYSHGLDIAWQKSSCILLYQESHLSNFYWASNTNTCLCVLKTEV